MVDAICRFCGAQFTPRDHRRYCNDVIMLRQQSIGLAVPMIAVMLAQRLI
jgi:hypothetical protein